MDDQQPRAKAVAVADGKIIGVGSRAEIERAHRTAQTALHDLQGHALLPAFFDAHSHFSMVGLQAISANLLPPPDGPGSSIAELQTALREHLAAHPEAREMNLLIGFNYDDSQLAENAIQLARSSMQLPPTFRLLPSTSRGTWGSTTAWR
jgi:predicted amidohydrolase YtcJ